MTKSTDIQKNSIMQTKRKIYLFMFLMLITGSLNTIANKLQNLSTSLEIKYRHTFFITFTLFLGESLCYIIYFLNEKLKSNYKENLNNSETLKLITENTSFENLDNQKLKPASAFHFILPSLSDLIGCTLMNIGLSLIDGSLYQMMRGSLIIFTAIFSVIFLKNKFFKFNFLGVFLVVMGLFLVGLSAFDSNQIEGCGSGDNHSNTLYFGIILVILAQIFIATQITIEESIIKKYEVEPLRAVGWEGIWGTLLYIILLIIFQFIECPAPTAGQTNFSKLICFKNDKGIYLLEDSLFALKQLKNNWTLLFFAILYVVSIGVFNFIAISITKMASASARAIIDTLRTITVWLFFILPIVDKCNRETFKYLQLIGFIFLILGTLIYNEIFVIPYFGLDEGCKKNKYENLEETT